MDQSRAECVLDNGVHPGRERPESSVLRGSGVVDGWHFIDEVNLIIKYVTACGCERLREESRRSAPPFLDVAMYTPSRIGQVADFDPRLMPKLLRRRFEFFNVETSQDGRLYIYREVVE